jgi:hypothetical protein
MHFETAFSACAPHPGGKYRIFEVKCLRNIDEFFCWQKQTKSNPTVEAALLQSEEHT